MNVEIFIPIVAMLSIFGMPVAIIYVLKHFRLKERELALEAGVDAEEKYKRLEARLDRIEKLLGSMESEIRALPSGSAGALPAAKAEQLYLPAPRADETKG
jgi:hypothetical protein